MTEKIALKNKKISNFEGLVTLTLDRVILHIVVHHSSRGSNCVTVPNFLEIARTEAEILRFFDFSRRRPPPSWILKISNV